MEGYPDNSACILDYLDLFRCLAAGKEDGRDCAKQWSAIQTRESATPNTVVLAPPRLRKQFDLGERELLLVMAAVSLEMDGGIRAAFRSRYGLSLPTIEYGLQLIDPLCPNHVETLAELAGHSRLTGLLLTTAGQTAYELERPLILCRAAVCFLTGLSLPDCSGLTVLLPREDAVYLPIYQRALEQTALWYRSGGDNPLCICGETGCGRRTLVLRACGGAVCLELMELSGLSLLDRDHLYREAAVLSVLLAAPVCAVNPNASPELGELRSLCRKFSVPLAVLTDTEPSLTQAVEMIRLPFRLSPRERDGAWRTFLPQAEPDSLPGGSMSIGAVREIAKLALRFSMEAGRGEAVNEEDTRKALRQRGGALAFGIHDEPYATLEDMVLPADLLEQIRQICMAARCGARLAAWGIPYRREGVTAVFHGPSGTGKTMAANAIARELGMPLLRADLAQIMDKYVGETEKHLGQLMRSARENRCVLLFDEADALFGKRTVVSTGHDKFSNLFTTFLLQEIEQYDGVALLSTNLLNSFDDAFLRRLQYIVRFTLPDAALREQLWRRALPAGRLEGEIPFALLSQVELSPARINSVACAAAVAAISDGRERISAEIVVRALRLELEKNGKALPRGLASLWTQPGAKEVQTTVKMM